jgi:hypothetical protein
MLKEKYNCNIYYSINYNYWRGDINQYSIFQHLNFIDLNNEIITKKKKYNEPNYYYNEILLNTNYNYIITGYYQSFKYFINYIDKIKNDLFINNNNKLYDEMVSVYENIKNDKETCLIHVRRGDYLKYPLIHPVCSDEYYAKAIKYIPNCRYIIFSDDLNYVNKWKVLKKLDYYIVEDNNPERLLFLMSLCDNFIIANSTLSLAAYYLRRNKYAKLTAPKIPKNYQCPICQRTEEQVKHRGGKKSGTWCCDHSHVTGLFRGWLCHDCNRGIGNLGDDVERLKRAMEYISEN